MTGKLMIKSAIDAAYNKDGTFAMQYFTIAQIDLKRSSEKHIYIIGAMDKIATLISGIEEKGGYTNGVAQTTWKITNIDVGTRQDDDALAYFASFTDKSKMCGTNNEQNNTSTSSGKSSNQGLKEEAKKQKEQLKEKLKKFIK